MMQQTLGIVPFNTKSDILFTLKRKNDVAIVTEKKFELSIETASTLFGKEIKESQIVCGFILEGMNVIQDWLNIISHLNKKKSITFCHGSLNLENSINEINWFQSVMSLTITKRKVSSIPTQAGKKNEVIRSKIPNKTTTTTTTTTTNMKTTTKRAAPVDSRKKVSLVTSTNTKLLTTTSKGGVSKNTPPTSIITGRTRKYSKLTEKKPVIPKPKKDIPVVMEKEEIIVTPTEEAAVVTQTEEAAIVEPEVVAVTPEVEVATVKPVVALVTPTEEVPIVTPEEEKKEKEEVIIIKEEKVDEGIVIVDQDKTMIVEPIPHPSTCSSMNDDDEHDAEVAATTSQKNTINTVKVTANFFQHNTSGRSSSFSPNSLPRPETPEVDQLRQRFETIIQTSSPPIITDNKRKMSYEFISRIKEMKPKDPVGTKVKSMVELFMDENLNKWEF